MRFDGQNGVGMRLGIIGGKGVETRLAVRFSMEKDWFGSRHGAWSKKFRNEAR